MIPNKDSALQIADFLLQIKAIILRPNNPFTWASGWNSPIYCDNRKALSYPKIRTYIKQEMASVVKERFPKSDAIVGVATGAIAQGALIAEELDIPFAYVRSSSKGHGLGNKIEGIVEKDQNIIVIEDLVSTGASGLSAITALREAGCTANKMIAIFTYGFEESIKNFEKEGVELITLTDYDTLIEKAIETKYISEKDLESLNEWRNSPESWGK